MKRFRVQLILGFASILASTSPAFAQQPSRQILLRSSWQTVNIGDIGHTPGMLNLLAEHLPDARVTLWAGKLDRGVDAMLQKNFPKVVIIHGDTDADGNPTGADVKKAFETCDFFLHGSGPSLVAKKHLAAWHKTTQKPFGIYGITYQGDALSRKLIDAAKFAYFRDTISLKAAKDEKPACPIVEFVPDAAFAVNLRNDDAALAFLKKHGLETGKFICVIPRRRYTPYWEIRKTKMTDEDRRKEAVNAKYLEKDHAKVREAMIAFIRKTGMKVLVCPEDVSQVALGKEMFVDPLPADVRDKVVWRDSYWLTDEAVSVYVRSLALLSMDMHSPIMAVGNGIPAIHCRFPEQTPKAQMWRDIGLGAWLFELDDEPDGANITRALLAIVDDPEGALRRVRGAMDFVETRQRESMKVLRGVLSP